MYSINSCIELFLKTLNFELFNNLIHTAKEIYLNKYREKSFFYQSSKYYYIKTNSNLIISVSIIKFFVDQYPNKQNIKFKLIFDLLKNFLEI